jgi:ankyrin repeat protein
MNGKSCKKKRYFDGQLVHLPLVTRQLVRKYVGTVGTKLFRQLSREFENTTDTFVISVRETGYSTQFWNFVERKFVSNNTFFPTLCIHELRVDTYYPVQYFCNTLHHPSSTLTSLNLSGNYIENIDFMHGSNDEAVSKLRVLNLSNNYLRGSAIAPLSRFTNLNTLHLQDNQISYISSLREMLSLTYLDLSNNHIENISPIKGLLQLNDLNLSNNKIVSIDDLKNLKYLVSIDVSNNQILDFQNFGNFRCNNMLKLKHVKVERNQPEVRKMSTLEIQTYSNRWHNLGEETRVYEAARDGHLEIMKFLFHNGASSQLSTANSNGNTPMMIACICGHLPIMQWLWDNGNQQDTTRPDKFGRTPTHRACEKNNLTVVKWLATHGGGTVDVKTKSNDGSTPTYVCCRNGFLKVLQWLFDHGAQEDIRTPNNKGVTPMMIACEHSHLNILQWLFDNGASDDVNTADHSIATPMYRACQLGNFAVVRWLFNHGADLTPWSRSNGFFYDTPTPWMAACQNRHKKIICFLRENGMPSTVPEYFAYVEARKWIDMEEINLVSWLVDHTVQRSSNNDETLKSSTSGSTPSMDFKARDSSGCTLMHHACRDCDLVAAQMLLHQFGEKGLVQTRDNKGCTPMYEACKNAKLDVMQWLFNHGGKEDVRTPDLQGCTPMYVACEMVDDDDFEAKVKVLEFLFDHGASDDICTANNNGYFPLYSACKSRKLKLAQWLYDHGGEKDISRANGNDNFPMHTACFNGSLEVVKWLLARGAENDILRPTNNRAFTTPLTVAIQRGHLDVVNFLNESLPVSSYASPRASSGKTVAPEAPKKTGKH